MKKMRKALLALLLSITVAGTSAAPVMAAGTNTFGGCPCATGNDCLAFLHD